MMAALRACEGWCVDPRIAGNASLAPLAMAAEWTGRGEHAGATVAVFAFNNSNPSVSLLRSGVLLLCLNCPTASKLLFGERGSMVVCKSFGHVWCGPHTSTTFPWLVHTTEAADHSC